MIRLIKIVILSGMAICLSGCSSGELPKDTEGGKNAYTQITQEQARTMMEADDGHMIVDVRRPQEYAEGHIPGAINIPNETIGTEQPKELPDLNQILLVYCRSGNRSKQAAQKLFDIGYTNVYEFGGINTWTGEIVAETDTDAEQEENTMRLSIGETEVPATWEDNPSVDALKALLPVTVKMSMYGGFEQVGPIGQSLVREDEEITTKPGDIVLYAGDEIVVFYGSNTWAYTKLGHIDLSVQELTDLLGNGDVVLTIAE